MIICPYSADQPFWARLMNNVGVASTPLNPNDLSIAKLSNKINELVTSRSMQVNASTIETKLKQEQGVKNTVLFIEEKLKQWHGNSK